MRGVEMGSFWDFSFSLNNIIGDSKTCMSSPVGRNPWAAGPPKAGFDIMNIPQSRPWRDGPPVLLGGVPKKDSAIRSIGVLPGEG